MSVVQFASDKKLMECVLCALKFSELDHKKLLFFPDSGVCHGCYQKMKTASHRETCFGKRDSILLRNKRPVARLLGYDPQSEECKASGGYCPDRRYCPLYLTGKIIQLQKSIGLLTPAPVVKSAPGGPVRPVTGSNRKEKVLSLLADGLWHTMADLRHQLGCGSVGGTLKSLGNKIEWADFVGGTRKVRLAKGVKS